MSVPPSGAAQPPGSRGSMRGLNYNQIPDLEDQIRQLREEGVTDFRSFYKRYMQMQQEQNRPRQSKMYYLGGY